MKKILLWSLISMTTLMTYSCKNTASDKSSNESIEITESTEATKATKETSADMTDVITVSELTGPWTATTLYGEEVTTTEPVTVEFMQDGKVHAKLGCNILNTTFTVDEAGALTFGENGQRTMMMCPDMQVEDNMVKAMKDVTKAEMKDGMLVLKDAQGNTLIILKK